jgi:UDP-glucose 4-epimerase
VRDLASAHLLALEAAKGGRSGAYNVGTGEGYSVLEVLSALEQETGMRLEHRVLPRRAVDPAVLVADGAKIRRDLGWQPQYSDLRSIVRTALDALPFAQP